MMLAVLATASLAAPGCGGSQSSEAVAPPPPPPSGAPAPIPSAAPAEAAPAQAGDPKILKLAEAALACPLEEGRLAYECEGYKAWSEEQDLFSDHEKAWPTLLAMLESPDEKRRLLAADKFYMPSSVDDKAMVDRVVAVQKKETNPQVAKDLASLLARIDMVKLGHGDDLRALAKHPEKEVRESIAFYLLRPHQNPTTLEVLGILLQDPERDVKRQAIGALSPTTDSTEAVCKIVREQMKRTDDLVGEALKTASRTRCEGIHGEVIDALAKNTTDATKIVNAVGVDYALAVEWACRETPKPEAKKKGFAVAKKLTDVKVPDANTRRAALSALGVCDAAAATSVLTALGKDKDKYVSEAAAKELAELKKKAAAQK
ncbi:Hypothetical protein CAP_1910 [Chondromyces apiculatus DSM 436]|uniref:HEAT repeat protein n=1 Tax=Chondromyces apiculatus DSM 436 TaxID=1192034 RepID=A0A017TC44_9BACT|nr:Hypothetical protein CAP_1910 [Chondromyces apiculatus DSM 436]